MKKKSTFTTTKKVILLVFYGVMMVGAIMLLSMLVSERAYLSEYVIHNPKLEQLEGEIKRFKMFYAGRAGDQGKLDITGVKKWIYLGAVSEQEKPYFATGNHIKVVVYQPYDGWLKPEYLVKHTLQSLGIKVNGQLIRSNESRKSDVLQKNTWMIAATLFLIAMLTITGYLFWRMPTEGHLSGHD